MAANQATYNKLDVVPGTRYAFRAASNIKVGEYQAENGQLRWSSTNACEGFAEALFAVLVEDVQVCVDEVTEESPGASLNVEYSQPDNTESRSATIEMVQVIDAHFEKLEFLHAKRES